MSLCMHYVPKQLIYAQEIDDYYCEYKCTLFTSYHTIVCKIWDVNLDTTSKHVCIYDWEKIGWVGITFILRKSWRFSHNDPHFVMALYKIQDKIESQVKTKIFPDKLITPSA